MKSLRALDKDKIRESLTNDDITKIMLDIGSAEPNSDNKGNLIYTTICHGGNNQKLYYYSDSQSFTCYTNCGGGKDIYQIVMDSKASQGFEFTFLDALRYVADVTGKKIISSRKEKSSDKISDWDWIKKVTRKKPKMTEELSSYDENVLDVFMSYSNNWIDEGITEEIAKKYEIGWYFKENQIIIPHRSSDGRLIGIRARNTDDRVERGMKYIPATVAGQMYNHLTMFNLYGLHITKEAIKRHKRVYIFEGEKSVMKSELYFGLDNFAVAVSGSNVSDWHIEKLLSYGVEDVILAMDKFRKQKEHESDEKYEEAIFEYKKKIARIGHKIAPYCRVFTLWDDEGKIDYKASPIDHGKNVFEYLTENKIEIKTKDVVF